MRSPVAEQIDGLAVFHCRADAGDDALADVGVEQAVVRVVRSTGEGITSSRTSTGRDRPFPNHGSDRPPADLLLPPGPRHWSSMPPDAPNPAAEILAINSRLEISFFITFLALMLNYFGFNERR